MGIRCINVFVKLMPHDRNYLRAYTLARIRTCYICTFYCWPFSEWQVDTTKEFLLQICEAEVDRMSVSDKENEIIHLKKWFVLPHKE